MAEPDSGNSGGRRWQGVDPVDRRTERKLKLIEAGIDLLAAEGPTAVTMREVCRRAGLTGRYFYESFDNRDTFLFHIFDLVVDDAEQTITQAIATAPGDPAEATVHIARAFTDFLVEDPRRGQVLLIQSVTSELYAHGRELTGRFTAIVEVLKASFTAEGGELPRDDAYTDRWDPLAVFGALAFVYQDWLLHPGDVGAEGISSYIGHLITSLTGVGAVGRAGGTGGGGRD
ncbi:TetR/AcrR family transcriptional regulator [Dietzia sp.]|uniref:TetR/AcrR family transcriptional regulator n=1 Tax=Dietzia sp. TaxID=1871616 RepID=UPI002FD9C9C5